MEKSNSSITNAWNILARLSKICFFSSRGRHTSLQGDWSSDVGSSDLVARLLEPVERGALAHPVPTVVAEAGRPVETARGDQDATERDAERIGDGSSARRKRVPQPREVPQRLRVELTSRLS